MASAWLTRDRTHAAASRWANTDASSRVSGAGAGVPPPLLLLGPSAGLLKVLPGGPPPPLPPPLLSLLLLLLVLLLGVGSNLLLLLPTPLLPALLLLPSPLLAACPVLLRRPSRHPAHAPSAAAAATAPLRLFARRSCTAAAHTRSRHHTGGLTPSISRLCNVSARF
jgi:hypothetical protein